MAYSLDLRNSSLRHFYAAEHLNTPNTMSTKPVAGYLYGIAAECALKEIMRDSGMRPLAPERRRDDPFYAHFPDLKTLLRDCVQGRRAGELRRYAEDGQLMNEWDTAMRYAPGKDIRPQNIDRWREHAERLRQAMDAA